MRPNDLIEYGYVWLDNQARESARLLARLISRRSFLGRLGAMFAGAVVLPLLPVARSLAQEAPQEIGDSQSCDYWRYCALVLRHESPYLSLHRRGHTWRGRKPRGLILIAARSILFAAMLFIAVPSVQADPKVDYLLHCSGCHLPDGSGHPPVVPTLHDVIGRMVAEPEGRSYIVRVPGVSQAPIDDKKLTELLNWMLTEFSSDTLPKNFKPLSVKEVKRARSQLLADPLKYRAKLFPNY